MLISSVGCIEARKRKPATRKQVNGYGVLRSRQPVAIQQCLATAPAGSSKEFLEQAAAAGQSGGDSEDEIVDCGLYSFISCA